MLKFADCLPTLKFDAFKQTVSGLIIDAFGDLRDQLEQVREDLESKCFICGIGKEYFDATPHGFDRHVEREHNFANYMYVFPQKNNLD